MGKKTNGTGACDNQTLTLSFVEISFGRLYNLYKRWSWIDPYYSVAFVYGALIASTTKFMIAVLYYLSGNDFLAFRLHPALVIFSLIIWLTYYYFHRNKVYYRKIIARLPEKYSIKDYLVMAIVVLMFSTWFISPVVYKWGANIH
jgi:hypothetical protein